MSRHHQEPAFNERRPKMAINEVKAPPQVPVLLTAREASAALRISHWKLYDLINRNRIDTIKIGRRRLVPAAELTRLIDELREEVN